MSQATTCPKCHRQVSAPAAAEPDTWVRCPHCQAKFAMIEALEYAPPMLEVVSAPSAVGDAATMDMLSWEAHQAPGAQEREHHAEHEAEPELPPVSAHHHDELTGAELPPAMAHEVEDADGTGLPPMADDWFAPGGESPSEEMEPMEPEEEFEMAGATERPVAPHISAAMLQAHQPTPAAKKRKRPPSEGGSVIGKLIAAVVGLVLAVIIVVPATWWILKKDLVGVVDKPWFPAFLSFALPAELKEKMWKATPKTPTNTATPPGNNVADNGTPPADPDANSDGKGGDPTMPKPGPNDIAGSGLPVKEFDPLADPKIPDTDPKPGPKPEPKPDPDFAFDPKPLPKPDVTPDLKPEPKPDPDFAFDPKPELKLEVKPEPKPEPKPAVGLKNAPVYTVADLNVALQTAEEAAKTYATARLDAAQEKTARRSFLLGLYALGEKATFTDDAADPSVTQKKDAIPQAILQGSSAADYLDTIGAGAALWIPHPVRKPTEVGIALAGTVTLVQKRGDLFVTKLALAGKFADDKPGEYLIVSPQPLPHVAESMPALILGVIVDKPAEMIDGFTGDEPRVIWSNYAIAVQK